MTSRDLGPIERRLSDAERVVFAEWVRLSGRPWWAVCPKFTTHLENVVIEREVEREVRVFRVTEQAAREAACRRLGISYRTYQRRFQRR